jgi:dimethylaniline monooxygenase (N-oxide forming)
MAIGTFLERWAPGVAEWATRKFVESNQRKAWTFKTEWRLDPAPSLAEKLFLVSDDLVESLNQGTVRSVNGIRRVVGPETVELDDGTTVDVDVIIFCTGYNLDYSLLGSHDPTRQQNGDSLASSSEARTGRIPMLYRGLFSLEHPDTLACMGAVIYTAPAFEIFDIASQAIAQLWRPKTDSAAPRLPYREVMLRQVKEHFAYIQQLQRLSGGTINPRWVKGYEWLDWAQQVTGNRIDEHLGWFSWRAWWFWAWEDRELARAMQDGIVSPHFWRLFDSRGRRKSWSGARSAIMGANRPYTGRIAKDC